MRRDNDPLCDELPGHDSPDCAAWTRWTCGTDDARDHSRRFPRHVREGRTFGQSNLSIRHSSELLECAYWHDPPTLTPALYSSAIRLSESLMFASSSRSATNRLRSLSGVAEEGHVASERRPLDSPWFGVRLPERQLFTGLNE